MRFFVSSSSSSSSSSSLWKSCQNATYTHINAHVTCHTELHVMLVHIVSYCIHIVLYFLAPKIVNSVFKFQIQVKVQVNWNKNRNVSISPSEEVAHWSSKYYVKLNILKCQNKYACGIKLWLYEIRKLSYNICIASLRGVNFCCNVRSWRMGS